MRKNIMSTIIRANYGLIDLKIYIEKVNKSQTAYVKTSKVLDLVKEINNNETKILEKIADLENKKQIAKKQMQFYRNIIAERSTYLFNIDEKKSLIFCELFVEKTDKSIDYQIGGLRKIPFFQLGTHDINAGFIEVSTVKIENKKLIISDLILDLSSGEIYKNLKTLQHCKAMNYRRRIMNKMLTSHKSKL